MTETRRIAGVLFMGIAGAFALIVAMTVVLFVVGWLVMALISLASGGSESD